MDEVVLKEELKKREVFFKDTYSREFLVHLLEMDILLRSQRIYMLLNKSLIIIGVKGTYADYGIRKITAFDVFNEKYGCYTGPMLSTLLKEQGIKPPRYLFKSDVFYR